ncbi:hypothetical protein BDV41DRAFT_573747 [Aspergillus transmontanensis]|uniref:MACPF-like domain-containing protein n=1 Tax=Aspergillus transmontanensis TaxID=1034304 RepID=A0A5N6W6L3_9EURO|nr:hypothetical protein BDV41DRAFT_573747 [Aspergillus transmontanensis]
MTAKLGELSSLYTKDLLNSSDYATTPGSSDFLHPEQMTGKDWDNVMRANRLLHGIYSDSTRPDVQRARKPVFRRKIQGDGKKDQSESLIPSFSICDNSNISVDESASEHKKSLLDFGFNGGSAELSVSGGGPFVSASASVSGSGYKAEKKEKAETSAAKDITISYKFPRVELYLDELDQEGWELTQECKKALEKIKNDRKSEDVYNFYETFGKVFAVTVKLGGRLTSTHHIEKNEEDKISEVKNKLRVAAAISVSGPVAAGSFKGSFEHQNENNTKSSEVSNKDTLAWEATGGDTTLASNPVAWAPTLKDHHNWRVTEITKVVPITQILDTMGSTDYGSLFQDIEYPPLVSMGKPHFETPSVAIVPDVQSVLTLYYQDSHGTIWECTSDGKSPRTGEQRSVIMARRNSPLVALNNPIIFVNPHGYLDELIYDTPIKEVNDAEVRLFYQDRDSLRHLIYRPGVNQKSWYKPPAPLLRDIVPKTPLAAGYQKGTWDHAREVPFVFFLRQRERYPMDALYPLYVLCEDTGYQNHWSVKEVSNSQFTVNVKLAVPNTLANDLMKSYYWLKGNVSYGDSPWGGVDIKSLNNRPEGVSMAVVPRPAQVVYFIGKDEQRRLRLYRRNSNASYTVLQDNNGVLLLE